MKVNELRIGNYYNHNGEIKKVTPNIILELFESERAWIEPIPITEEWLLKLGFEKIGVNFQFKGISIWFSKYSESYQIRYCLIGSDIERKINIEYVHQLQNLIFALTGEELIFKQQPITKPNPPLWME